MPEKPKLKSKQGATNQQIQKLATEETVANTNDSPSLSSYSKDIPLMFQAQIQDRGNIQYVGDQANNDPKYKKWVEEWLHGCPPLPEKEDESIPKWKNRSIK